jgi:hypothetical protein
MKYTPPPPDSDDGLQDRIERLQQERDRIKGLTDADREREAQRIKDAAVPDLGQATTPRWPWQK